SSHRLHIDVPGREIVADQELGTEVTRRFQRWGVDLAHTTLLGVDGDRKGALGGFLHLPLEDVHPSDIGAPEVHTEVNEAVEAADLAEPLLSHSIAVCEAVSLIARQRFAVTMGESGAKQRVTMSLPS